MIASPVICSVLSDLASLARSLAKAIWLGTDWYGNALVNAPTGGYLAGIPVGTTTATLAGGIGIDDLELLFSSVDESYASVGSFYMHQKTRSYLLSQKDSAGRSLYGASPQDGLVSLFGRPVRVDNNLPAPTLSGSTFTWTASSTPVVFGDHSRAYGAGISPVSVRVLKERYADLMLNSLLHYVRIQSVKLVGAASAKLQIAAA
jgi:HK97 family phage major capsid protein